MHHGPGLGLAPLPARPPAPRAAPLIGRRHAVLAALAVLAAAIPACLLSMPGRSLEGALPVAEAALAERLAEHVEVLAGQIGERHVHRYRALRQAEAYVAGELGEAGPVQRQVYTFGRREVANLALVRPGTGPGVLVVGAHYDSAHGTPGADDNASGVAVLIELAKRLDRPTDRSVHLVAFVNEEQPFFRGPDMGSVRYAATLRGRDVAMISLESLGYYDETRGSQRYPFPFALLYPRTGDFVAFVGHTASRRLVRRSVGAFREAAVLPSEGAAVPIAAAGLSDHWAFHQRGWPALMVTDTAPFRNPHYHRPTDTPETLDYARLARVVQGMEAVVTDLAGAPATPR